MRFACLFIFLLKIRKVFLSGRQRLLFINACDIIETL